MDWRGGSDPIEDAPCVRHDRPARRVIVMRFRAYRVGFVLVAGLVLAGGLLAAPAAHADEDSDACMRCHGNAEELRKALQDPKQPVEPLLVDAEVFARTVHMDVSCTDCHQEYSEHPHTSEDAETLSCAECHEEAAEVFAKSIHGQAMAGKDNLPAACTACHGVHDIFKPEERESRLHPLNVYKACGTCHFETDPHTATAKQLLDERLTDDAHARGILLGGLVHSATCVSCHGGHAIRAADDPESPVSRERVEAVCGACHVGVVEQYRKSVHYTQPNGSKEDHEKQKGATCTDCHLPHTIGVRGAAFRLQAVESCSKCHADRSATFKETYHGKVVGLGFGERVATCDRCHGNHMILPSSNPASTIHSSNIVGTCGECHENSHTEFAKYHVHADPHDAEANPGLNFIYVSMILLLIGTFAVALLHSLLWLIRSIVAGDWRKPPVPKVSGNIIRRWRPLYSGLHIGMMVSFLALASTGLPIHFSDQAWAQNSMNFLGGPEIAQFIHRTAAVMLITVMLIFIASLFQRAVFQREKGLWTGPNTMLPTMKDLQDIIGNLKWFLGLGPRPRWDRWTYWEKFDFWAVFWGMAVIGGSGLVLWFPVAATTVLPAWFLNVAVVVHGHEALLAVGFIFSIHIFNTHLRPEKFPMDLLFVTGRMTEEEFKHERPLEYERAVEAGTLEAMFARRPRRRTRIQAYVLGTIAICIGCACVLGMLVPLLS